MTEEILEFQRSVEVSLTREDYKTEHPITVLADPTSLSNQTNLSNPQSGTEGLRDVLGRAREAIQKKRQKFNSPLFKNGHNQPK